MLFACHFMGVGSKLSLGQTPDPPKYGPERKEPALTE
jgi:hypothetical protein